MTVSQDIAARIEALRAASARVLVAVDGPDAAGKTTFGDTLAALLTPPVRRASIDDFHNPEAVRRQRGELSPEGYYRDAFDLDAVRRELLEPFRDGEPRAVLVFDGVFLLRPELRMFWTLSVYLHVSPEETLRRALVRDLHLFDSPEALRRKYELRYLPAQSRYRDEWDPQTAADVVLDNTDPANPIIR